MGPERASEAVLGRQEMARLLGVHPNKVSELAKTSERLNKQAAHKPADTCLRKQAMDASVESAEHQVKPVPQLLVNDITSQALVSALEAQDGVLALMSDEPHIFPVMLGKYNDKESDFEVYLASYSGTSPLRVGRMSRKGEYVKNPRLTLLVCLQPDVLSNLSARPEVTKRGLLPRMAFVLPQSRVGMREWSAW